MQHERKTPEDNKLEALNLVFSNAEGEITGRIRVQKIFYLLEKLNLVNAFTFSYHHYGPYSESLSNTLFLASESNYLKETEGKTSFGSSYSVYKKDSIDYRLINNVTKEKIAFMKGRPSVIIEIAATILWLKEDEGMGGWRTELEKRKGPNKASADNIEKALSLLSSIGFSI